ncbi:hypothetical protein KJ891_01195, partial [Candidatus Micrarchaeota archaeon]|nr:hypothetical protein [Candidatus Micrarchaeota archaeon]
MRLQFTPEKKAQGPMEYLLIIGGLVLVAVVVIVLLLGMTGDVADTAPGLSASGSDITRGLRYSGTGESPPEGGEVTPPGTVPPGTEPPKGAEEICDNGIDDDSDDKVDCFDDSCACVLTLESPAPGDIISNPPADSFAFRWTEISGAKEYLLEYAATNPLSKREIRMSERTQETSFEVGSDAFKEFPDGTINWTVAALDGSGKELVSSPSEFHKFYGKGGIALPSNRRTYFSLGTWFQGTSLPHAAEYGIGMQRMQANWKTWEVLESAGNGEAYFEVTDLIIELAERNGVAIMISPYSTGKGGVEWDESCDLKDKQSYLDFLGGLLDRYKGRIEFWEIWNEPNLVDGGEGEFWCTNRSSQKVAMEGYARLLGDAYN